MRWANKPIRAAPRLQKGTHLSRVAFSFAVPIDTLGICGEVSFVVAPWVLAIAVARTGIISCSGRNQNRGGEQEELLAPAPRALFGPRAFGGICGSTIDSDVAVVAIPGHDV